MKLPVSLEMIREARERIREQVPVTPLKQARSLEGVLPGRVWLKLENQHRTGSFKERGALNRLLDLDAGERKRGVITASAGNHAQAVAFHATRLRIPATVLMPGTTPLIKVGNTRRYGADVILHGQRFSESIERSHELCRERDLTMVHAYDDPLVVAGQGTIGLELHEQLEGLDHVVVPIGGGGVISGTALALKALMPGVRVVGVEAEAAPSALRSREAGKIIEVETSETLADGIAVKRLGEVTFPLIETFVDDIVTVGEEEIANAILHLLEQERLVVEGAGAAPLAALLSGRIELREGSRAVAVLCGGNIDVNMIARIIDRGLVHSGRMVRIVATVRDRPGSLAGLTREVARAGANVLEVAHQRAFADISVGEVEIAMQLETRGPEHVDDVLRALSGAGARVRRESLPPA